MTVQSYQSLQSVSNDYFHALFKYTRQNHVLLMDTNGIIAAINPSFTATFGYEERDIIGSHIRVLFTKEDQAKGLPEQELANVLSRGQSNDNNYLVHKNQTLTYVSGESILAKGSEGKEGI